MLPSQVVKKCEGCLKIVNKNQCSVYTDPSVFERPDYFMCPVKGYTDFKPLAGAKERVGQQKQGKWKRFFKGGK